MENRKILLGIIVVILIVIGGVIAWNAKNKQTEEEKKTQEEEADRAAAAERRAMEISTVFSVNLNELNKSKQSGQATAEDMDGKTKVMIALAGGKAGVEQPAHFHVGTCAAPGDIAINLLNVSGGKSETELDISTLDLKAKLPLALVVHKSVDEMGIYVACGDVIAGIRTTIPAEDTTGQEAEPKIFSVSYGPNGFNPAEITISAGDTVKFTNTTNVNMEVASDPHPAHSSFPLLNQNSAVGNGGSYQTVLNDIGIYIYHNHNFPNHKGTIIVK